MSDLRPEGTKIKLGNKEYGLRFTLNAIDDIQDHYDIPILDLPVLFKDNKKRIKALKYLITLLVNEDIDCINDDSEVKLTHIDERFVGRHIDSTNINEMIGNIYKAFSEGTPESDDDDPNAQSE